MKPQRAFISGLQKEFALERVGTGIGDMFRRCCEGGLLQKEKNL